MKLSKIFVDPKALVPVTVDENTIYIIGKMNFTTYGRVEEELMKLEYQLPSKGKGRGRRRKGGKRRQPKTEQQDLKVTASVATSAQKAALLAENIKRWEGPLFRDENDRPVPCTPEYIKQLDPNNPLVEAVLEEIDWRNSPPEDEGEDGYGAELSDPNPIEAPTLSA